MHYLLTKIVWLHLVLSGEKHCDILRTVMPSGELSSNSAMPAPSLDVNFVGFQLAVVTDVPALPPTVILAC